MGYFEMRSEVMVNAKCFSAHDYVIASLGPPEWMQDRPRRFIRLKELNAEPAWCESIILAMLTLNVCFGCWV